MSRTLPLESNLRSGILESIKAAAAAMGLEKPVSRRFDLRAVRVED